MSDDAFDETDWIDTLTHIAYGQQLSVEQSFGAMEYIFCSTVPEAQLAAFIMGLTVNNITVDVLEGISQVLQKYVRTLPQFPVGIDIVGTGGDKLCTANISTLSAIVTAASGVRVLKHGSRSSSSPTGSADLLASLGIELQPSVDILQKCAQDLGICFFYAPYFHPGLSALAPIRRQLAIPTIFNLIGPLANPLGSIGGLIGCATTNALNIYRDFFSRRTAYSLLVRGDDGQDEISTTTVSDVFFVGGGYDHEFTLNPRDFGFSTPNIDQLRGGDVEKNTAIALSVLGGEKSAFRDAVLINAGTAITIGMLTVDSHISHSTIDIPVRSVESFIMDTHNVISDGIDIARIAIDSGAAWSLLEQWKELTSGGRNG